MLTADMGLVTAVILFLLYTMGLVGTGLYYGNCRADGCNAGGCAVFHEIPGVVFVIDILIVVFAFVLLNNFGRKNI